MIKGPVCIPPMDLSRAGKLQGISCREIVKLKTLLDTGSRHCLPLKIVKFSCVTVYETNKET